MWDVLRQLRDALLGVVPIAFLKLLIWSPILFLREIFKQEGERKAKERREAGDRP
jgi:hypothetical protein